MRSGFDDFGCDLLGTFMDDDPFANQAASEYDHPGTVLSWSLAQKRAYLAGSIFGASAHSDAEVERRFREEIRWQWMRADTDEQRQDVLRFGSFFPEAVPSATMPVPPPTETRPVAAVDTVLEREKTVRAQHCGLKQIILNKRFGASTEQVLTVREPHLIPVVQVLAPLRDEDSACAQLQLKVTTHDPSPAIIPRIPCGGWSQGKRCALRRITRSRSARPIIWTTRSSAYACASTTIVRSTTGSRRR